MPDTLTQNPLTDAQVNYKLTNELTENNLNTVALLIQEAYNKDTKIDQFKKDTAQVTLWFSTQLDPIQIERLGADVPHTDNPKEDEKERLLVLYAELWKKLTESITDSDVAAVQELVKQKAEADARLAEKESKLSPAEKFIEQAKSRALKFKVRDVLKSEVEHAVPSTPTQRDPLLEEYAAKAVEGIPIQNIAARETFIQSAKAISAHAATAATHAEYSEDISRLMGLIDGVDSTILPKSARESIAKFVPAPTPLAAPEITTGVVQLIAAYPGDPQKAQGAIVEYLTQNTAAHLSIAEATELAKLYLSAKDPNHIAQISNQAHVVHMYTQKTEVDTPQAASAIAKLAPITSPATTPEAIQSEVQSTFPKANPKELSQLSQDLLVTQEITSAMLHSVSSKTDLSSILIAITPQSILSAVLPDDPRVQAVAIQTKASLLTRIPTEANATNLLASLGYDSRVVSKAGSDILTIFSPTASPEVKAARPQVLEFLMRAPKQVRTDQTEASISKFQGELTTQISQMFPAKSAEAQILTSLSPILARGFTGSPEAIQYTFSSTIQLYAYLGAGNTTTTAITKLSPLLETLRLSNPNINRLISSTSTILESHSGLTPQQLASISNQLTLFHLTNPHIDQEKFQAYFDKHIVHRLEALGFTSDAKSQKMFTDLHAHFKTNPLRLSPDQQIISSLTTRFTKAGLTPEQARALAPHLYESAKLSFYFSGFAAPGRNLNESKAYQAAAFAESFRVSLASLVDRHPILAQLQLEGNFKRLGTAQIFNDLHTALGDPKALPPAFLVQIQSPIVYSFTQYISGFVPAPIRPLVTNAAKYLLGSTFLQSEFAKQTGLKSMFTVLAAGPTKFRMFGMFSRFDTRRPLQSIRVINRYWGMYDPRIQMGKQFFAKTGLKGVGVAFKTSVKAAWTKFAGTAAGKAVVAVGAKIAANAAVQTVLQVLGTVVAPIIGNIVNAVVGWIIGDVLTKLLDAGVRFIKWLKDEAVPALVTVLSGVGFLAAGASLPVAIPGALLSGLGTSALQNMLGGKAGGLSSNAVNSAASRFNYVVGSIATAAVGASLSGVIAAVIAVPMVTAFIIFIITSSAYIVPPTYYNSGSGDPIYGNNSSCPLSAGRITSWSYDVSRQESQGGERAHGANGYWRDVCTTCNSANVCVTDPNCFCSYHLPSDGVSCAPSVGSTNYCYNGTPRCGGSRSPFYGYAIDVVSSDRNVYLPQINGESTIWEYRGLVFRCNSGGCPHRFSTTTADGSTYIVHFLHMAEQINTPPQNDPVYRSSFRIGTLFDQGTNTHLHLEVNANDVYIKPESLFCGTNNVSPSGFITVNCTQPGPYGQSYIVPTSNFTNTHKPSNQTNFKTIPLSSQVVNRVRDIVNWGNVRGYDIYVDEGHRSYTSQLNLCEACQNQGGGCNAERAEYSQHRTGRAIDIYDVQTGQIASVPQNEILNQFPWLVHPVPGDPPHYCISLQPGDCDPL